MKLSERQAIFTKNIAYLIFFADSIGIKMTFGDAYRSKSQQILLYLGYELYVDNGIPKLRKAKKASWTMNSYHLKRLAVDFNFFIDGELVYDKEKLDPLGKYWLSLHEKNRWGGYFKDDKVDTPHFQMIQ